MDPPLSDAEYKYLDSIKAYIDRIFFLLYKIDTMSEQEYGESLHFTKALIEKKPSIKDAKIFLVSAKQALEAKISKNTPLYEKSGFKIFENELDLFIKKDKLETLTTLFKCALCLLLRFVIFAPLRCSSESSSRAGALPSL